MKKCSKCELNFINDDETLCKVCSNQKKDYTKLQRGVSYGSNSLDIYNTFCETLKWDESKNFLFGRQNTPLFAHEADQERKRGVWFIFHSNLRQNTIAPNGKHLNIIKDDLIAEYYEDAEDKNYINDRIVFVKNQFDEYEFFGVYAVVPPHTKKERIFKRISDNFPIQKIRLHSGYLQDFCKKNARNLQSIALLILPLNRLKIR